MLFLILGLIFLTGVIVSAFLTNNWPLIVYISGGLGAVTILLASIVSGALVSGDRIRINYLMENDDDRKIRLRWMINLVLFALPNVVGAVITFSILTNK